MSSLTNGGRLESWDVDRLIPYEKNAKIHDPAQVMKIAAAIKEFGWDQPIVVDAEGVVIKGHGRRLAAIELGMKKVPVLVRDDLTPDQVKAARISDNRVAQGDVDFELLQGEISELNDIEFNMESLGFDARELSFMTEELDLLNQDAVVEDLDEEVTAQTEQMKSKAAEVRERKVPLSEAFGFKSVSPDQARVINKFMGQLEGDYETKGAEALMQFMQALVGEGSESLRAAEDTSQVTEA